MACVSDWSKILFLFLDISWQPKANLGLVVYVFPFNHLCRILMNGLIDTESIERASCPAITSTRGGLLTSTLITVPSLIFFFIECLVLFLKFFLDSVVLPDFDQVKTMWCF